MAATRLSVLLRQYHGHCGSLISPAAVSLSHLERGTVPVVGMSINFVQVREMSRVKTRITHPYHPWARKRRERNDQELTQDNQDFINKVIYDKYGPLHTPGSSGIPFVSPLKQIVYERGEWEPRSIRTGVIARKIGIYPMWDKNGLEMSTTLLQVVDNHVVKYIPPEVVRQNYGSRYKREDTGLLIVGAESADPQRFTKEYLGLFEDAGLPPKTKISRFMVSSNARLQPGTPLYATHFKVGQRVEIFGKTIDRGFQGVMKRWLFAGMPATMGVTKSHRRGGNTGGGGEKGRIWPGQKLPGHMGNRWRKLLAQEIVRINTKYNVIYVKGSSVMGEVGSFVTIHDSFLDDKFDKSTLPFPTHYPEESEEPIPEEYFAPQMFNFVDPSITFDSKV